MSERRERRLVAAVIAAAIVAAALPYLYGWLTRPADEVFLGLVGRFGNDQAFYLGWGPKQAQDGHVLFEDKFNGEADRRLVFNSLWLAMGWTARLSGLDVLTVFHLERVLFSVLLLVQVYLLAVRFLERGWQRVAAVAAVAFGSGYGVFGVDPADWTGARGLYRVPDHGWTPDLAVAESNAFLVLLAETVLPAALALLLLALRHGLAQLASPSRTAWSTGALTLLLGTVYPYAVVSTWAILGGVALLAVRQGKPPRDAGRAYATIVLASAPIVLYDLWLVLSRPALTEGQALYASPSLGAYFVGFGSLSVLACLGAFHVVRQRLHDRYVLLVWIAVTFVGIYSPRSVVPFQMQLILGVQVPLAIVAVLGAARLWQAGAAGPRRVLARLVLTALAVTLPATSLYHYRQVFAALQQRQLPEYMDRPVADGLAWLAANAREDDVALATLPLAPYIPVLASCRVYSCDYAAPTADFERKRSEVAWVMREALPGARSELAPFLRERQVDLVVLAPALEQPALDAPAGRDAPPGLRLAFANDAIRIYRVEAGT